MKQLDGVRIDVLWNEVTISFDRISVLLFDCAHTFSTGTLSHDVCSSDSRLCLHQSCVLRDSGTPLRLPKPPQSDIIDDSERPFGNHVDITDSLVSCSQCT